MRFLRVVGLILLLFILVEPQSATAQNSGLPTAWTEWRQLPETPGLQARVRISSYNEYAEKYHWLIQFRNRYQERVCFSYILKEEGSTDPTNQRQCLNAGATGGSWYLLALGPGGPGRWHVVVDRFCRASEPDCL